MVNRMEIGSGNLKVESPEAGWSDDLLKADRGKWFRNSKARAMLLSLEEA